MLEDPDYRFEDLVCLVFCLYAGKLNLHASFFSAYHSARGQLPAPTLLQSTTESPQVTAHAGAEHSYSSPSPSPGWYKSPDVARRLNLEYERLMQRYRVETAIAADGRVILRLMPKKDHEDLVFYLACGPGFPDKAPVAFVSVRGDRYPLLSPGLSKWSAEQWLVEMADDLVEWLVRLLDQQIATAEEAMSLGEYQKASDLLAMVLLINPRKPRAAWLLAQTESLFEARASE